MGASNMPKVYVCVCVCVFRGVLSKKMEESQGHLSEGEEEGNREKEWIRSRDRQTVEVLCGPVFPRPLYYPKRDQQ